MGKVQVRVRVDGSCQQKDSEEDTQGKTQKEMLEIRNEECWAELIRRLCN
jgi:hypothetical protein